MSKETNRNLDVGNKVSVRRFIQEVLIDTATWRGMEEKEMESELVTSHPLQMEPLGIQNFFSSTAKSEEGSRFYQMSFNQYWKEQSKIQDVHTRNWSSDPDVYIKFTGGIRFKFIDRFVPAEGRLKVNHNRMAPEVEEEFPWEVGVHSVALPTEDDWERLVEYLGEAYREGQEQIDMVEEISDCIGVSPNGDKIVEETYY